MKLGVSQFGAWVIAVIISATLHGGLFVFTYLKARSNEGKVPPEKPHASHVSQGDDHSNTADEHNPASTEHHDEQINSHQEATDHNTEEHKENDEHPQVSHDASKEEHSDSHADSHHEKDVGNKLAASSHQVHWTYKGNEGPDRWSELDENFAICGSGERQSPINLEFAAESDRLQPLRFGYTKTFGQVVNNGHTIQINLDPGNVLKVGEDDEYALIQLHFHSPSEHREDNIPYPLEMHLVHKNKAGKLAVVGVFFEEGRINNALREIFDNLPKSTDDKQRDVSISPGDLLPEVASFYHYSGSLTTPPCSEGVNWFVMTKPLTVSAKQVENFVSIIGENARPTQSLKGRKLLVHYE